jgi:putative spermidine/putrescine transport system permease protein
MEESQSRSILEMVKKSPMAMLNVFVFVYLLAPLIVVVWTSFGKEAFPQFPPEAYSLRWYSSFFSNRQFMESIRLSLLVAFWTTIFALLIGIPGSLALVRFKFRGSNILNTLCMSPILFPAVVIGIALLVFYSKTRVPNTIARLVFAHVLMTIPFVIRLVSASLYGVDRAMEEASLNLGASRLKTFFRVTMPLIKPGIIAGGLFAFFISFDEVTVTLFIAGARLTTLPIRIYTYVEYSSDPTVAAVSAFLILVALCIGVPLGWKFLGIRR